MRSVIFYLGCVGLFLTLSLIGPIFIALLGGELAIAQRLFIYLLLGTFVFAGPMLATLGRGRRVPQIGGLVLVALVWTVMPVVSAIPIADLSELSLTDSLFEAVSGLTTTGSTTFNTVDGLSQALLFWRSQLQWIGGFLALITVFAIIAPMGIGGLSLNGLSIQGQTGAMAGQNRLRGLIWNFGLFYLGITVFAFLMFSFSGVRAFHSATLAMAAVSTGGFLPFDRSLDQMLGPFGLFCFAIFLLFGATSVFWHRMILRFNLPLLKDHRESYSVLALALVLAFCFAVIVVTVSGGDARIARTALVDGFVNGASLVATSGVETQPGIFTLLPLPLILFVVLLGGSAFSTSGGLKHYRIGAMIVQSWSELDRLIYPHAVRPSRFGTQRFDLQLMKAIWSFFVMAILTISFGTSAIALSGIAFEPALTVTIASFSTAGPVYDAGWSGPGETLWPPYSDFTDGAKWVLMAVMLLGRLEVLAVLGLFSSQYWRNR